MHKPLLELSSLLGFDIPAAPHIDLASIKADGAIVHWSLREKQKQKSTLKYSIHLNGVTIGTVPVNESAVTITGLQPGRFYVARVALINGHEFSSKSTPVRFRTKAASSGDYFVASSQDGHETDVDAGQESVPRVRPYRGLKDITLASPDSAPMARSGSTGLDPRRASNGRRPSPAALGLDNKHDPFPDDSEPPEGAETIQQLTKRLDAIRRETDEAEKQAKEEEEEEARLKEELTKERDELRGEVNEREKASRNLKREITTLERLNTHAHNERSKQERLLLQKKSERQKLKDDMVKWERETEEMNADVERMQQEKEEFVEQAAQEKETLRTRLADEAAKVRELDDRVKETMSEIKKLERAAKDTSPIGTESEQNLVQQFQQDAEEERNWQHQKGMLQQQYMTLNKHVESAKRFHADQNRFLEELRRQQYASPPPTQERLPRRENSQRSRHAASRHSISDSPRLAAFQVNPSPFASHANPLSTGFNSVPFLNVLNGMTISPTDDVSMSEEERNQMTGGAAMSPSVAAELLPRDLLLDDRNPTERVQPQPPPQPPPPQIPQQAPPQPPTHVPLLPGLAGFQGPLPPPLAQEHPGPGPASPASVSSKSASIFASPRASQNNLNLGSPDGIMDADRRSIRSTRSNRATSGSTSSRFSGMFGIKPRNKTMDDGPPLSKSSSMPRADQMIPGLGSTASRKRNSSISGTIFQGALDGSADASTAASSRRTFGFFSKEKTGGWPETFRAPFGRRPASPRPVSTHSNELPRPSMDSTRWGVGVDPSWPSSDAASGARNSPLAFGPGWSLPASQQSRFHGSRHPSRRPSVQYAGSGPPEDIMEDEDSDALSNPDEAPHLAPIGTKPPPGSKKAETAAKLNPTAKDFKSFLGMKFGKDKAKSKDRDRDASQDGSDLATTVPSASTTPNLEEEESPPNSRKSRDVHSMTTTESSLAESGRNSSDLARTPSYSNSDVPSPSLAGSSKETFMQKITRKSSSGKFALPTFKREKSHLNPSSATSAPYVPAEQDEDVDDMSTSVGSLRESSQMGSAKGSAAEPREGKEGNRSSRSWSAAFKIGKKKGETPSLSEMSLATSEEGEEEEAGV